ncbi:MAG TPA: hypothetical protein VFL29_03760 [Candidatus Dormibacteraeota bacterium]|nr:hypothetical protein [Candidatus Dormibacteraeota bacterium]
MAIAVGLASMDMPIPHVDSWEWANWKFPRQVKAGDTVYARWTLTQKRAPVRGARTAIVVWRVDVHTADGAMCAEGEVGASVFRTTAAPAPVAQDTGAATAAAPPASRRRRRKRGSTAGEAAPAAPPPPPPPAQPHPAPQERAGGGRRRRRRRTSGGGGGGNGNHVAAASPAAAAPPPAPEPAVTASPAARANANPLSRVMKRLRGASSG